MARARARQTEEPPGRVRVSRQRQRGGLGRQQGLGVPAHWSGGAPRLGLDPPPAIQLPWNREVGQSNPRVYYQPEARSGCRVVSDFSCVSKCLLLRGGGRRLQQGMDRTVDCLPCQPPPGAPPEGVRGAGVDLGAMQSLPSPGHGKLLPKSVFPFVKGTKG